MESSTLVTQCCSSHMQTAIEQALAFMGTELTPKGNGIEKILNTFLPNLINCVVKFTFTLALKLVNLNQFTSGKTTLIMWRTESGFNSYCCNLSPVQHCTKLNVKPLSIAAHLGRITFIDIAITINFLPTGHGLWIETSRIAKLWSFGNTMLSNWNMFSNIQTIVFLTLCTYITVLGVTSLYT